MPLLLSTYIDKNVAEKTEIYIKNVMQMPFKGSKLSSEVCMLR